MISYKALLLMLLSLLTLTAAIPTGYKTTKVATQAIGNDALPSPANIGESLKTASFVATKHADASKRVTYKVERSCSFLESADLVLHYKSCDLADKANPLFHLERPDLPYEDSFFIGAARASPAAAPSAATVPWHLEEIDNNVFAAIILAVMSALWLSLCGSGFVAGSTKFNNVEHVGYDEEAAIINVDKPRMTIGFADFDHFNGPSTPFVSEYINRPFDTSSPCTWDQYDEALVAQQ